MKDKSEPNPTEQALWKELPESKQANISGGTANQAIMNFELSMPVDTVEKASGSTHVRIPVKVDHDI